MTIEDWAIWLEGRYRFSKDSREGWFSQIYYSFSTGWSQVLLLY